VQPGALGIISLLHGNRNAFHSVKLGHHAVRGGRPPKKRPPSYAAVYQAFDEAMGTATGRGPGGLATFF
jgi:hypothetical protein